MWVRGLKHSCMFLRMEGCEVAPYVGAWIETLKAIALLLFFYRRTLCGCVD